MTEKFGSENFEVHEKEMEFEYWFNIDPDLNNLKMFLIALTKIPFRKLLKMHEVGLPNPEYYRIYKK
jgi:hypothetical protein